MIHLAIPAFKALHRAFSSHADRPKYKPFAPALCAACEKINKYYEKPTEFPTYIMSMSTSHHPFTHQPSNLQYF